MIIDLQRRLAEVGRVRIGQQVMGKNGKSRPEKLSTFRLTSPDRLRIDQAASIYGGQAQQWQAPSGPQWEVVTTSETLDVIVPPSDMSFSQHYELWSAGGCRRRCDGRAEQISEGGCLCDPENRECNIHTRLSVMLRDLPGLGVWRIDTSGYYAAVELQGAVEVIQVAAGRGQMLPARLRLEQRQVKRIGSNGKPETRNFAVPVLDIEVSPGQLMGGQQASGEIAPRSDGPSVSQPGPAQLTPVPASLPSAPVRSIGEQVSGVDEEVPRPRRRNAAQDVPSTGLEPRTVTQAAADTDVPSPVVEADGDVGDAVSDRQRKMMHALLNGMKFGERSDRIAFVAKVVDRPINSTDDLSAGEVSQLIEAVKAGG